MQINNIDLCSMLPALRSPHYLCLLDDTNITPTPPNDGIGIRFRICAELRPRNTKHLRQLPFFPLLESLEWHTFL